MIRNDIHSCHLSKILYNIILSVSYYKERDQEIYYGSHFQILTSKSLFYICSMGFLVIRGPTSADRMDGNLLVQHKAN